MLPTRMHCKYKDTNGLKIKGEIQYIMLILVKKKARVAILLSEKVDFSDFWPKWRHSWVYFASQHNQKKDNNKFKN